MNDLTWYVLACLVNQQPSYGYIIYQNVKAVTGEGSLPSVYRILGNLVELGWARRLDTSGRHIMYVVTLEGIKALEMYLQNIQALKDR